MNLTTEWGMHPCGRHDRGDATMVARRPGHMLAGCRASTAAMFAMALAINLVDQSKAQAQPAEQPNLIATCAPCHGFEGIGKDVEIPNLAGQHDVYLIYQLRAFRSGKRKHTDMSFIARELTDTEINALATYYSGLPPR